MSMCGSASRCSMALDLMKIIILLLYENETLERVQYVSQFIKSRIFNDTKKLPRLLFIIYFNKQIIHFAANFKI